MNCIVVVGVLLCFCATICADKVDFFANCSAYSPHSVIHEVSISDCTSAPCPFKRGTYLTLSITFTPDVEVQNCNVKAFGLLFGVAVPYTVEETNCCKGICPVAEGQRQQYSTQVYVKPQFPNVSLVVRWELRFNDKDNGLCFMVPVQIV